MSVTEIKTQIKTLTPAERREIELLLHEMASEQPAADHFSSVKVPFDQAVDRVFQKHAVVLRKLSQ